MVRCYNSLCLLRTLFVSLLAYSLLKWFRTADDSHTEDRGMYTKWSEVDIWNPPNMPYDEMEESRLNELFASTSLTCSMSGSNIQIGISEYSLCQPVPAGECLLITSSTNAKIDGVEKLNCSKWTVFLPLENMILDGLKGDVEVNYLMEIDEWTEFKTDDILQSLKHKSYSHAILHLERTRLIPKATLPKAYQTLIQNLEALSIFLRIEVGKADSHVPMLHSFFYTAFTRKFYALSRVSSSFGCVSKDCVRTYHVAMLRYDPTEVVRTPVMNFGSPTEERKRLLRSMNNSEKCHISTFMDQFFYNNDQLSVDSSVVMISKGNYSESALRTSFPSVEFLSWSQRAHREKNILSTSKIINRKGKVGLLVLDVDGFEWDILNNSSFLDNVKQISIGGRLYVEENEIYRRYFSTLEMLRRDGFRVCFSRIISEFAYKIVLLKS